MERLEEMHADPITGESYSVTAVSGAPQAAVTVTTEVYNPSYASARHGDRARVSIDIVRNNDQEQLHDWLRSYKVVREAFQEEHVARAHEFSKISPAMGIVAARQVLEIPNRGALNMLFMRSGGVWIRDVADAFGVDYDSRRGGRKAGELHRAVFDTPQRTRESMQTIIKKSRQVIGRAVTQAWQEAVIGYEEIGDKHATGMSYVELGKAFLDTSQGKREEALSHFSHGVSTMVDKLDDFPLRPPVANIVEVDELNHHLTYAVRSVVSFDTDLKSRAVDVDAVKRAAYQLDDYGVGRRHVLGVYAYLGRRFSAWRGRRFFRREVKQIESDNKLRGLLDRQGIVIGGPSPRKDYRHQRP